MTEIPPGFPLPPASVGHAVQTDQRSHDKERANTGALSAASTSSQTAGGHRKTDKKEKGCEKEKKKKSPEDFFFFWLRPSEREKTGAASATGIARDDVVYWESVE